MLPSLESGDRRILIGGVALLAALTLLMSLVSPRRDTSVGYPSSYSAASDGAKAAYLLLKDLGVDVVRWERPPTDLPDRSDNLVLVLADPVLPISQGERAAILRFVTRGGRVVATGAGAADLASIAVPQTEERAATEWRKYRALLPSPLTSRADEITMSPQIHWRETASGPAGLYGDAETTVVATMLLCDGRVVWWAAGTPLTNAGLKESGNLELMLDSIGPLEGTRVLWDEYYHGHRGSLGAYIAGTPVPWGLLQSGLVLAAAMASLSRRRGPVRPPPAAPRLSAVEFVDTVADLYRRARAAAGAVEIAAHRFRGRLAARLGLPPTAPTEQLCRDCRLRLGWSDRGLFDTLRDCDRAVIDPGLDEWRAFQLVQALHGYTVALGLATPPPRGKG